MYIISCWYVGCATTISDLRTSDCNRFIFSISSGVFSFSEDDPSLSDLSELSDFPRPLSEALPKPESHSLKKISGMSQIGSAIFGPWISGRLGSGLDMGKKIFTCEYFLRKQQNCHPIHALAFYFYTFWASQRLIYHLKNNIRSYFSVFSIKMPMSFQNKNSKIFEKFRKLKMSSFMLFIISVISNQALMSEKDVLEFRIRKTIDLIWNSPSEPDQFDLFRPVEPPSKSNRFK